MLKMSVSRRPVKQEHPYEDLSAILDSDIQLTSVDKESEGLITQQIEEILPAKTLDIDNEEGDGGEDESVDDDTTQGKPKKRLRCRRCDFKSRCKKELRRHESRHAIKGWYHECGYCEYVTYTRQRLVEHESKHTNTRPFECEKCEFKCRFRADLYKHQAKHSTVKRFHCPKCDFRTKWCRNIKHHLLKHSEDRPHSCHICGFTFKRIQDLKYHLYRHSDLKPIECDLCDFRCKTNYELKCHRLKHSSIKNFACTFPGCMQRTKTKSDLTKHMKTHNKSNNYLCAKCGKGFNTLQGLNKHKDRHITVRKFKCGLCEKWFKTKPSLRAHMKIHTGVKPFQCDICPHRFNNKYNMKKHMETHSGDRPYMCPICPYGARISEHLLAHIGSMHGESHAYFCELCRKPFKRYSQLQVHIKRMHKNFVFTDRASDGRIDIKLEAEEDGTIATGNEAFTVKRLDKCNFEPVVKRKRGRPPKKKNMVSKETPSLPDVADQEAGVEQPKKCGPVEVKEEPTAPYKLTTFENGIRLPLASKGFHFNFDKTGKKPRSWFMQPENMYGRAAVRQRVYMEKKERVYDKAHSGNVPRVRKKMNVLFCLPSKFSDEAAVLEDISIPDPHKLVITGRHSLKTMRKMRRRIRRTKESLNNSSLVSESKPCLHRDEKWLSPVKSHCNSEDEDDVPLCQLIGKTELSSDSRSTEDSTKHFPDGCDSINSCLQSPGIPRVESAYSAEKPSHIKMVLKRKRKSIFKVTMSISDAPSIPKVQVLKSSSDGHSENVRVLGQSVRERTKTPPVQTPAQEMPTVLRGRPRKVSTKESKGTQTAKRRKYKNTGKGAKKTARPKSKKRLNSNKSSETVNESAKRGNIPKNKRKARKKAAKGKKTSSARKTKSAQNRNSKPKPIPKTHLMTPQRSEDFPIKMEPPDDDDYVASLGRKPSEVSEVVIKQEDRSDHLASCCGSPLVPGFPSSPWSAPFKYLYDGQSDEPVTETNYTEHAVAWGLKGEVDCVDTTSITAHSHKCTDAEIYIGMPIDPNCEAVAFECGVASKLSALENRETSISSYSVNEAFETLKSIVISPTLHSSTGRCAKNIAETASISNGNACTSPESCDQILPTRNKLTNCSLLLKSDSEFEVYNMACDIKPDIRGLIVDCNPWSPCPARDIEERSQESGTCREEMPQSPPVSYTYMF